jgi:hypothetical protein
MDDSPCHEGPGPIFVRLVHHAGYYQEMDDRETPAYSSLDRAGSLFWFHAIDRNLRSTGQPQPAEGLHNITMDQVEAEMARMGATWSRQHDYAITAFRATVPLGLFQALCDRVPGLAASTDDRYSDCYDGPTVSVHVATAAVNLTKGQRLRCGPVDPSWAGFATFSEAYDNATASARQRAGA